MFLLLAAKQEYWGIQEEVNVMKAAFRRSKGQVTVEVAILFGFVVAALVAMAIYLQRGVQGGMKSNADSMGTQYSATTPWWTNSKSHTDETAASVNTAQTSKACQGLGGAALDACVANDPAGFAAP